MSSAKERGEYSRSPDMVLKVMNKITGQKSGKIGAAWKNETGTITLVIDYPNKVEQSEELVYTLFPNTPKGA